MTRRTMLVIAHRPPTDRIVALDEGRSVEQGTHDRLAAAGRRCARLAARQCDERRLAG